MPLMDNTLTILNVCYYVQFIDSKNIFELHNKSYEEYYFSS